MCASLFADSALAAAAWAFRATSHRHAHLVYRRGDHVGLVALGRGDMADLVADGTHLVRGDGELPGCLGEMPKQRLLAFQHHIEGARRIGHFVAPARIGAEREIRGVLHAADHPAQIGKRAHDRQADEPGRGDDEDQGCGADEQEGGAHGVVAFLHLLVELGAFTELQVDQRRQRGSQRIERTIHLAIERAGLDVSQASGPGLLAVCQGHPLDPFQGGDQRLDDFLLGGSPVVCGIVGPRLLDARQRPTQLLLQALFIEDPRTVLVQGVDHADRNGVGDDLELADGLHPVVEKVLEAGIESTGVGQRHRDDRDEHRQR